MTDTPNLTPEEANELRAKLAAFDAAQAQAAIEKQQARYKGLYEFVSSLNFQAIQDTARKLTNDLLAQSATNIEAFNQDSNILSSLQTLISVTDNLRTQTQSRYATTVAIATPVPMFTGTLPSSGVLTSDTVTPNDTITPAKK